MSNSFNLELNLSQFTNLIPFFDAKTPVFQIKLSCSCKKSYESLLLAIKQNNIKILSTDSNDDKNSDILDPKLSYLEDFPISFDEENEEKAEILQEKISKKPEEISKEEEEKKEEFYEEILEKTLENIDPFKLLYLKTHNPCEILDEFCEDPAFSLRFSSSTSIMLKGHKKPLLKAERQLRRILISLCYKFLEKTFISEESMQNYLKQDFLQEILEDFGIKTLEFSAKNHDFCEKKQGFSLIFFVEDKARNSDLEEAIEQILLYKEIIVNLNKILEQFLTKDDKNYSKVIYKIKLDYIQRFLTEKLKEKARSLSVKFVELTFENSQILLKLQGNEDNLNLFKIDLQLFLSNLKISLKTNRFPIGKKLYYNKIEKNLESFEEKILNEENKELKFPLIMKKKYQEVEETAIIVLIGYFESDISYEKFKNFADILQKTLDFQEKTVQISSNSMVKRLKNNEDLEKIEKEFDVKLFFNKRELKISGNIEKILQIDRFLSEEEKEAKREKFIYYFKDPLFFLIFCKYELILLEKTVKNSHLILENSILRKETKSFEFITNPEQKEKIIEEIDAINQHIALNIEMKFLEFTGISKYKLLKNPDFLKKLVNFDMKNPEEILAIELLTDQKKLNLKKIVGNSLIKSTIFSYKELLEIYVYDGYFPEEIAIKGLVINIDVKGGFIDEFSEKISQNSETHRFVAKEINKLNDNNMNKKKRAEVFSIVECRNPSKNYDKIVKLFYSIINTKKIMSNYAINYDVYSMSIDRKTKKIYQDFKKFDYGRNLISVFNTILDEKIETLGIVVPYNEIDVLVEFLCDFCKNNQDFSTLKKLHLFTNDNAENTTLCNKLRQFFSQKTDISTKKSIESSQKGDISNIANPSEISQKSQNISLKNVANPIEKAGILNKKQKEKWWFENAINRDEFFNEIEYFNIRLAISHSVPELYLIKQRKQGENSKEIYLNIKENKATDLSNYKPLKFDQYIDQNLQLKKLVKNYREICIPSVTFYEDNSNFLRLDFKKMIVEEYSQNFNIFPLFKEEFSEEDCEILDEDNQEKVLFCGVSGYKIDVEEGISRIKLAFEEEKLIEDFILPKNFDEEAIVKIYKNVEKKYDARVSREGNTIKIQGFKEEINEVKSQIIQDVYQEIERITDKMEMIQYPNEWTPQQDNYYSLIKLKNSDQEYIQIASNFLKTMAKNAIKILKIKRIQNKMLYSLYYKARSQMKQYKKIINETVLFHGSGSNDPKVICEGKDVGFDMRLAKEGMWGTAIYFAENANYADKYSFVKNPIKSKKKRVLLANVLLGESVIIPNDSRLKRPPFKNEKEKELYDSVQGRVDANSSIFMIYDNNKAYPAYIITYL